MVATSVNRHKKAAASRSRRFNCMIIYLLYDGFFLLPSCGNYIRHSIFPEYISFERKNKFLDMLKMIVFYIVHCTLIYRINKGNSASPITLLPDSMEQCKCF